MRRYDLAPKDRQFVAEVIKSGDIALAVEIANRLIWEPFTKDAGWVPMASEKLVRALLACHPKILKALPGDALKLLNFAAVMAELLGPHYREADWLPEDLEIEIPMHVSAAVNMFGFCVRHYDQIQAYAMAGVNRLTINVAHNTNKDLSACAGCESLIGTVWTPETIPELPYEKCVNFCGCRCLALADV